MAMLGNYSLPFGYSLVVFSTGRFLVRRLVSSAASNLLGRSVYLVSHSGTWKGMTLTVMRGSIPDLRAALRQAGHKGIKVVSAKRKGRK